MADLEMIFVMGTGISVQLALIITLLATINSKL